MKIAGRKNDGAWFRANKFISQMGSEAKAALKDQIMELDSVDLAYNAIAGLAAETGVTSDLFPSDSEAWVDALVAHGIPRQIYMGLLSFDTYSKQLIEGTDPERFTYVPNHAGPIREFGKEIRHMLKQFLHGIVAVQDLTNTGAMGEGNPGGYPDASPEGGTESLAVPQGSGSAPKASRNRFKTTRVLTPVNQKKN